MLMIIIFYLYQIVKPQNQMSSSSEVNNLVDIMICWSQLLLYASPSHTHSSRTYHYTQMLFVSNNYYTSRDMYNCTSTEFHLLATNLFQETKQSLHNTHFFFNQPTKDYPFTHPTLTEEYFKAALQQSPTTPPQYTDHLPTLL